MVITSGTVFDSKHALEGAVDEWFADTVAAEVKYGHIGSWNTSRVTDFSELFCAVSFCSHYNSGASSAFDIDCLLYTSPSPRDQRGSRMPSSA